jgi:hypothetical protein
MSTIISDNTHIPAPVAELPIAVLCLSLRTENALVRANVATIGSLCALNVEQMVKIRNIGTKAIDEITQSLSQFLATAGSLNDDAIQRLQFPKLYARVAGLSDDVLAAPISMLPISNRAKNALTNAQITTIRMLIPAYERGFDEIQGLGARSLSEIEQALLAYLDNPETALVALSEQQRDNRQPLVELPDTSPPDLLTLIVPFTRALLRMADDARKMDVLKRRFGLERSKEYTLQEIGDYYGITRERVRQLESRALRYIHDILFGNRFLKEWRVPSEFQHEAQTLRAMLTKDTPLLLEKDLIQLLAERYDVTAPRLDRGALRLLLHIFGFTPVPTSGFPVRTHVAWSTQPIDVANINRILTAVGKVLDRSGTSISYFDLKVEVTRRCKGAAIDHAQLRQALLLCADIEAIDQNTFQIPFALLQSLADKAYRVLYEANAPLHLREICKQINHRLAKQGLPADAQLRSIQGQLVGDRRFVSVGRSGLWSLAEWQHITTTGITDLMREFFHRHGTAATHAEVSSYVYDKRPDISPNSIGIYLSTTPELFVRVSAKHYELTEWGSTPYKPQRSRRKTDTTTMQHFTAAVQTLFATRQTTSLPQAEVVQTLAKQLSIPESSVYVLIKRLPFLRFEAKTPNARAKKVVLLDEALSTTPAPIRRTKRETIQDAIVSYLERQPNARALVADVAKHLLRMGLCQSKPTFYHALARLEQVGKEPSDTGTYCYLKRPPMPAPQVETPFQFAHITAVKDQVLREQIERAVRLLTADNVDVGLFQLGKLFEAELKAFLECARDQGAFAVTAHDLSKLVFMIECVDRNQVTRKKHLLTLLREQRNERAHGEIPGVEERQRLLAHAPFLGELYIEYIALFNTKRLELSVNTP